jgi:hypothetical protein
MALTSSFPTVDPRPVAKRILVSSTGLATSGGGYTVNNQMGNAFVFNGAARRTGGYGMVSTITLVDEANIIGAVDLYLFAQAVTPASDRSAVSFSDSDMQHYVGTVSFPAPTNLVNNRATSIPALGMSYVCANTSLYGYLVTLTSHTTFNDAANIRIGMINYLY